MTESRFKVAFQCTEGAPVDGFPRRPARGVRAPSHAGPARRSGAGDPLPDRYGTHLRACVAREFDTRAHLRQARSHRVRHWERPPVGDPEFDRPARGDPASQLPRQAVAAAAAGPPPSARATPFDCGSVRQAAGRPGETGPVAIRRHPYPAPPGPGQSCGRTRPAGYRHSTRRPAASRRDRREAGHVPARPRHERA